VTERCQRSWFFHDLSFQERSWFTLPTPAPIARAASTRANTKSSLWSGSECGARRACR
jgi:hypothetical protein